MNKSELLQKVIDVLQKNIEGVERRAQTATQASIDAPGAMQSHSDTTKSQMGQIANALQKSLSEQQLAMSALQTMISMSRPSEAKFVEEGSLVEVTDGGSENEFYLILPAGGGIEIEDRERTILIVTPQAPIAITLMGMRQGESVEFRINRLARKLTILNIQ
jgi:transcription elongation GreA/GreB family factor